MDIVQQLILLLLGLGIGLVAGIVIGIVIQTNRQKPRQEAVTEKPATHEYGSVDPDSIHTLPAAEEKADENGNVVCSVCGHTNPTGNLFCYDCGARL